MASIRAEQAFGFLTVALAAGAGLYGVSFWLLRDRGPEASAFAPAAQKIRDQFQAGDLILLVPEYATRSRELLGDLDPVASADPLGEDLETHPRVWVFGLFGKAESLRPELAKLGLVLESSDSQNRGITVDLYRNVAPIAVPYVFDAHLKEARVIHEHEDGSKEPCSAWNELNAQNGRFGRWSCPHDGEWFYVAPEWHRMGEEMRFCLWAHPPGKGRLAIHFPRVPLTGRLVGRAGHTQNGSLFAHERIDLDVAIEGVGQQRFPIPLEEHWLPFALTTPIDPSATATVTFAVSSPDAGTNHFCFRAEMRAVAKR